jgi:hypothetical protein
MFIVVANQIIGAWANALITNSSLPTAYVLSYNTGTTVSSTTINLQTLFPNNITPGLTTSYVAGNAGLPPTGIGINGGTFYGTWKLASGATVEATYSADLAERYNTDTMLGEGDVVVFGGSNEITISTKDSDENVFGVISTNAAYKMNAGAGSDETHPYVALAGRVPCKVVGVVNKFDKLVTSDLPGHARAFDKTKDSVLAIFGTSLTENTSNLGVVEVVVKK